MRQRRLPDDKCEEFVDVFMKEMHATFPNMVRLLRLGLRLSRFRRRRESIS